MYKVPDSPAPPCPSLLLFQLKAQRCTVGELVDFANNMPAAWVGNTAASLARAIKEDHGDPRARRRKLVLLGALLNRVIFEIEGVPKARSAHI